MILKFNDSEIESIRALLKSPQRITITTHKSPDGDAIGSSLGMCNYLLKLGHEVKVVVPDSFPDFLGWMPGIENIINADKHPAEAKHQIKNAPVLFCLDFNTANRVGKLEEDIVSCEATKIMIDHHQKPDTFCHFTFSDTRMSSTCEMVYDFICALGDKVKIDESIGTCLYAGIITDTASFRFDSASSDTLRKAAELIDIGVKHPQVLRNIYDTNTFNRLQLTGNTLSQRFHILPEHATAYLWVTEEDLHNFNYQAGDTEGLVNYGLSIKGINFSAFFTEKNGEIKISFRSKGAFDVNQFSRDHFSGGGHRNAAGGISKLSLNETISKFVGLLPSYDSDLKLA